ncbi:UNVERIFIED_CONTAM: exp1-like protein [Siphonaria sp. JEL0065]|nr:exp1-like protein [Siphonaria sp. JEL0065]
MLAIFSNSQSTRTGLSFGIAFRATNAASFGTAATETPASGEPSVLLHCQTPGSHSRRLKPVNLTSSHFAQLKPIKTTEKLTLARRKLRALGKPSVIAPKRPLSSYFFFAAEHRAAAKALPHIKQLSPQNQLPLIAKELGVRWKNASAAERQIFDDKAANAKTAYEAAVKKYIAKRTPEDLLIEEKTRSLKQTISPTKNISRVTKDPNAPKSALSAYTLFVKDISKNTVTAPGAKAIDTLAANAKKWKTLSDAEKKPYVDEAVKQKAAYTVAKEAYLKKTGLTEIKKSFDKDLKDAVKVVKKGRKKPSVVAKKVVKKPAAKKKVATAKKVVSRVAKKSAVAKTAAAKKATTAAKKTVKKTATA